MVYLSVSIVPLQHFSLVRDHLRWLLRSAHYKAQVLAQPDPGAGKLRHSEWDGWGFAGEDTTVFLAFDPTDSLAAAVSRQAPVNAATLPCEVARVRRLESHWYAVLFYTDTYWGTDACK